MLTLITGGEVYAPERRGVQSVLICGDRIGAVGDIDAREVERYARATRMELEVVDASGRVVVPGFLDPHEHLTGGSGEESFRSRTPEITPTEILRWGITTVVGTLGADTITRTMPDLLAAAKSLREHGLSVYLWSGGYHVPPMTLTGDLRKDIMFVEEIIGAGEIAISDHRSVQPDPDALVKVVVEAHLGGAMSGKCGATHFHVGEGEDGLRPVSDLLERYSVQTSGIYVTHVERSTALMDEAIALAQRGCFADIDLVEDPIAKHVRYWREHDGPPGRLTFSTDADSNSPRLLYERLCHAVVEDGLALEEVLPHVTTNTAHVLQLRRKGTLSPGQDADAVVMETGSLDITHVFARGQCMVRDGELAVREHFLAKSNREIALHGDKAQG